MITTRRLLRRALPTLVLATAVLLGGCGSDGGSDGSSDAASDPTPELSDAALEAYFEAVASYDPDLLADARESAEPDSNADHYAGYLQAFATAAADGGSPIDPSEVEQVEGGFRACGGTGEPPQCVTWADIETADGALVDFTVDGQSLDDILVAGDGSVTDGEDVATVEFLYSYKSPQSGTQFVAALVEAGDAAVQIGGDTADYQDPDGSDYPSAGAWGPSSVAAGESATVVLPFENAPVGGTASLPLSVDGGAAPVVVTIETAP
jgi:hypothetical protein